MALNKPQTSIGEAPASSFGAFQGAVPQLLCFQRMLASQQVTFQLKHAIEAAPAARLKFRVFLNWGWDYDPSLLYTVQICGADVARLCSARVGFQEAVLCNSECQLKPVIIEMSLIFLPS